MKKLVGILMGLVLASEASSAIVSPQAYWSFEGDSGAYGVGSNANPAWGEKVSGTAPDYIGSSSAPAWPEITTDGIKGDAFYATDPTKSGQNTMTLNWTSGVQDVFSSVASYTVCGWINTRDVAKNGSDTYLLRALGAGLAVKWRADGRVQVFDSVDGAWRYSDYSLFNSNDEWVFFAITRDSSSIRFWVGSGTEAVSEGTAFTGLTIGATATSSRFIIGGYTYNSTDNYAGFDMDELRIYSATTGDSGALTLSQLEAIRQFDVLSKPEPAILAWAANSVFFPSIQPAVYLDFEYHGSELDGTNPAFGSKAPGNWSGNAYIGSGGIPLCSIAENAGVDGRDCLDKTMVSFWGATSAFISFGSDAPGYDNDIEDSLDNAYSLTICGWLKTTSESPIGGNGHIYYRQGQIELYAPDGSNSGKLALKVPAGSGGNVSDITVMSDAVYDDPNQWVFFAAVYDGTKITNNVQFYVAGTNNSVASAGTGTINAGQLTGGEHYTAKFTGGGLYVGASAAAGYFDKITVFSTHRVNDDAAAMNRAEIENIRRWHLHRQLHLSDALVGDTNLDGDVDSADIATINSNLGLSGKFWTDGDMDGDMDVDSADLDMANANFTGPISHCTVQAAVVDSMTKVNFIDDFTPQTNPEADIVVARGEHEHIQIVVKATDFRIENVSLNIDSVDFPASAITVRRAEKVRIGIGYDELYFDPLINENTGTALPSNLLLFWVSFDVPYDQPAGNYSMTATLDLPAGDDIVIPIELNVRDFTICREQHFQTSFNLFRQMFRNYYGGDWDDPTNPQYRQWLDFCLDYRISPIDMSMGGDSSLHRFVKITRKLDDSYEFDFADYNAYLDYGYDRGMRNFNIGDLNWHFWEPFWGYDEIQGVYREFNLPASQHEEIFAQYISEASYEYRMDGPRPYEEMVFFYAFDELHPGMPDVLQEAIDRHDRVEENWPALRTLSTGEPLRYPSYEDHTDIWCGKIPNYYQYTEPAVDRLRLKGNEFWLYVTGYSPPYSNLVIQEPGIDHRLIFWQNFVERSDGFLHWGLNVWPHYRRPNAWAGEMTAEAEYDKWPNRAWDDAGWVIKTYTQGGGYLIYPSPDGPVASIRLEMMRDGIEDWELLNMLGKDTGGGVYDGLIARAESEGISASAIISAKAAANISDVVTGLDTYSSDPVVLEGRRQQVADAIENLVSLLGSQKPADLNSDGSIDFDDVVIIFNKWLESGIGIDADINCDEIVNFEDFAVLVRLFGP